AWRDREFRELQQRATSAVLRALAGVPGWRVRTGNRGLASTDEVLIVVELDVDSEAQARRAGTGGAATPGMSRRACLVLALVAGCTPASGNDDPPDTARVKYHMRQRFNDVRTIERMLVAGKLEEARTLAFMLARPLTSVPPRSELRD